MSPSLPPQSHHHKVTSSPTHTLTLLHKLLEVCLEEWEEQRMLGTGFSPDTVHNVSSRPVCLPVCMSVCLSVCLFVCLPLSVHVSSSPTSTPTLLPGLVSSRLYRCSGIGVWRTHTQCVPYVRSVQVGGRRREREEEERQPATNRLPDCRLGATFCRYLVYSQVTSLHTNITIIIT